MVSLTMRSTCAATRTSTAIDFATPPAFSISVALLLADSARTSATITFAPSSAKRIALARPIPEPAPVINATLSLSNIVMLLCDLGGDAVAIAPGQDMNRQCDERQVDEYRGPPDIWRTDPEQHRDSENHDT